jgi:hypothetical protein
MRRRLSRSLAAVFTAWFAIAMVEPAVLHACPVHDAGSVPAQSDGHAHVGHDTAPSHPTSGSHCLCLGDCTNIASVGLPSPVIRVLATPVVEWRDTGLPHHAYVPVAVAHAIPFANGPPAV